MQKNCCYMHKLQLQIFELSSITKLKMNKPPYDHEVLHTACCLPENEQPPPSLHKVFVYLVNEEVHGVWIVLNHLQETWKPLPSFWRAIPHGFHHALYHSAGKGWQLDLRQCPLFCQIKWCVQFWIKLGVHMSGAVAIWKQQQWCQTLGMQCSVVVQNVLPVHWPVHATTMQSIHIIYVHDFLPSLLPLPCCYCIATTLLIPYHMLLHC